METKKISRRDFVILGSVGTLAIASGSIFSSARPVVSVVKIKRKDIHSAVQEAIELLGGMDEVARNKQRIMLKPNLVNNDPRATTNPEVIKALVKIMKSAGKEVCIGEGSAAAPGFNVDEEGVYKTTDPNILDPMQQFVFDELGYTALSKQLDVPLVNLHTGEMVTVNVPDALLYDEITVHKSLSEIDLLCSVPMMKTHSLATVTLGMKNLIGLYPGKAYCTVRSCVHNDGAKKGSPGIAFEIIDMVKACTPGLVVIDASTSMEGNGPTDGDLVKTNLIIAGTDPLATDLVAAHIMGFDKAEVPTFMNAIDAGMGPASLSDIEIRGEYPDKVQFAFRKPDIVPWTAINSWYGVKTV